MELHLLIEAVECGDTWRDIVGWCDFHNSISEDAYNGSLDAAKSLHDALLPGYKATVNMFNCYASVKTPDHESHVVFYDGVSKWYDDVGSIHVAQSTSPARAWLLAILKAYQQVQRATT